MIMKRINLLYIYASMKQHFPLTDTIKYQTN
jgi:hypothetical protein